MNPEIDITDVTLKTDRLLLRAWTPEDLHDLYEYASVDGIFDMIGRPPHRSLQESEELLNRWIQGRKNFAIVYHGKAVGTLGIERYNEALFPEFCEQRCREISFVLSKSHWGHGLVPEAVREVIRYLFEDAALDVIFCGHFVKNIKSARVQEKCGFHHYAFRKYQTSFGTVEDDDVSILSRKEWESLTLR